MEILAEGRRFEVSISAGVVQCGENFQSWLDMLKEADRLMYKEKNPIIYFYTSGEKFRKAGNPLRKKSWQGEGL